LDFFRIYDILLYINHTSAKRENFDSLICEVCGFFNLYASKGFSPKPFVFPDFEINPDLTVALFWQRILNMDFTIAQSKNDIGFIQYLGDGIFSDLIYIG